MADALARAKEIEEEELPGLRGMQEKEGSSNQFVALLSRARLMAKEAELAEEWGAIAMQFSAKDTNLDKIKSLVTHGVDVNVLGPEETDEATWTPLHVAAWHNQVEAAQLLIDLGAKVEARDENVNT